MFARLYKAASFSKFPEICEIRVICGQKPNACFEHESLESHESIHFQMADHLNGFYSIPKISKKTKYPKTYY